MLGGDEDDVVGGARDGELREVERLGVDLAGDGECAEQAEAGGVDVGGGERGFVGIEAGAGEVVFVRGDVDARRLRRIHGEGGVVAGDTAGRIGDHHAEGGSVIGLRGGRSGVTGRSGPGNVGVVLLPLIGERRGSRGGHGEAGGLTQSDGLIGGLRGDGRTYRLRATVTARVVVGRTAAAASSSRIRPERVVSQRVMASPKRLSVNPRIG
jgi:hypothetical protein